MSRPSLPRLLLAAAAAPAPGAPGGARAQGAPALAAPRDVRAAIAALPFGVGERLEYDAKVGPFKAGRGHMEVVAVEDVRGHETLHLAMHVSGGALGWKVRYQLDSWVEPRTFSSLRHTQDNREGSTPRTRAYEIFPERGFFTEADGDTAATAAQPLDDASFLYFVRTVPLVVGETYTFDRYFRPDRNPVRVTVVRKERVKVPAGEFETIVLRPVVRTKGLLSEAARTEVWLTDDPRRMLVKMETALKFGTLSLHLRADKANSEGRTR
ncbi:DUF3108 domain-containing protein [Roseisolibacter sp. H3M3-2]|uniref:DUF3108 domain-containing protein n=1 Tax=Roseisolibacter sp. H3M3-2 TaxID=3031323 RepID=UPI0023DC7C03|nr:DUF3108 domain-containing protein [Roseisolibacter sp. H3M3-2]MDF1504558.1 DUF3108 domain-containing protein [Roseisolibacter sp. H3M3-2]